MSLYDGYDDEYQDALVEARRDAYLDKLDESGWTCSNPDCGAMWDPGWTRSTRFEQSYPRHDTCPRCGDEPITDVNGFALPGALSYRLRKTGTLPDGTVECSVVDNSDGTIMHTGSIAECVSWIASVEKV